MTQPVVDGVIDLTFLDIRDENDFQTQFQTHLEQYNRSSSPSKTRGSPDHGMESPSSGTKRSRKEVKAIRLGNNYLSSVEIIHSIPARIDSSKILWLDLSFNEISTISEDFALYFPQVTTIYLHANKISKLSEIKKLAKFQNLR